MKRSFHMSEADNVYMGVANAHATLSKANRLKVGACIVTPSRVIIPGVNGQPKILGNVCELDGVTKASVIHAELNCILKAQREGISIEGATLYVTHSPCEHCASLIIETGISRVVYAEEYRSLVGVENLKIAGGYRDWETDRKSTRLNSSHSAKSRMPSSA